MPLGRFYSTQINLTVLKDLPARIAGGREAVSWEGGKTQDSDGRGLWAGRATCRAVCRGEPGAGLAGHAG